VSGPNENRYSEDEVSRLIKRALKSQGQSDTISHSELLDIAEQSGVSAGALHAVLEQEESSFEIEEGKRRWLKRHREDFHNHLRTYIIINGFLVCLNIFTAGIDGPYWCVFPIMGWGIGLLIHASETYFVSDEKVERGARKLMRRRRHIEGAAQWMEGAGNDVKKQKWYCEMEKAIERDRDQI
jgi:hypothetical protein